MTNEMALLGTIIRNPDCFDTVRGEVSIDEFQDLRNKRMYQALNDCHEEYGTDTDLVILRYRLNNHGHTQKIEDVRYMVSIVEDGDRSTAKLDHYIDLFKTDALRARTSRLIFQANQTALDGIKDPHGTLRDLKRDVEGLLKGADKRSGEISVDEGIITHTNDLIEGNFTPYISTGFKSIDLYIGGFGIKEGLTVIGARPSMGKTALAVQMLIELATNGTKVGMFSIEMSKQKLYDRMLQVVSGISIKNDVREQYQQQGFIEDWKKDKLNESAAFIRDRLAPNMWIDDQPSLTIDQIECNMSKASRQCDVLFVDHLQEMQVLSKENRAIGLADVVRRMRNCGKGKYHTVLLCQLNRNLSGRQDKMPNMTDLKECGGIEETADNILLLHREDYYHQHELNYIKTDMCQVNICKSRDGETWVPELGWEPQVTRFKEN